MGRDLRRTLLTVGRKRSEGGCSSHPTDVINSSRPYHVTQPDLHNTVPVQPPHTSLYHWAEAQQFLALQLFIYSESQLLIVRTEAACHASVQAFKSFKFDHIYNIILLLIILGSRAAMCDRIC